MRSNLLKKSKCIILLFLYISDSLSIFYMTKLESNHSTFQFNKRFITNHITNHAQLNTPFSIFTHYLEITTIILINIHYKAYSNFLNFIAKRITCCLPNVTGKLFFFKLFVGASLSYLNLIQINETPNINLRYVIYFYCIK